MSYEMSLDGMRNHLSKCKPVSWYTPGRIINVDDLMNRKYSYRLTARYGKDFDKEFTPELTPHDMLSYGVFEGKYLNDCMNEFPREWYADALRNDKLSPEYPDISVNMFNKKSRQSLRIWRQKGWSPLNKSDHDIRGWFQWYCRYYIGRRDENVDDIQIKRWKSFIRHKAQILHDPRNNRLHTQDAKMKHRAKQRQALLQWAYYPLV